MIKISLRRWIPGSLWSALGISAVAGLAAFTPAEARGGHRHAFAAHGGAFAASRRHGNDAYLKAAEAERDKLLDTKLKSICRGC
jgi:hypothetical protein